MRYLYIVMMMLIVSGCSVKTLPPMQKYKLEGTPIKKVSSSSCQQHVLKVMQPFSTKEYIEVQMHYNVAHIEENMYNNSTWDIAPSSQIYINLVEALRESGVFHTVLSNTSIASNDLVLEVEIDNFKQYFSKDLQHSYVVIELVVTLVDKKEYKVIAQKRFYKKLPVASLDAKGGVIALNQGLNEILVEIVQWLKQAC